MKIGAVKVILLLGGLKCMHVLTFRTCFSIWFAVRYKISARNAVMRLWVPWKSAKGRPLLVSWA